MVKQLSSMKFAFGSRIELMIGDSFYFENGYNIELSGVSYVDDIEILKLPYKQIRKHQTKDKFHYKENSKTLIKTRKRSIQTI